MKKRFTALLLIFIMLTGCGSGTNTVDFDHSDISETASIQAAETQEDKNNNTDMAMETVADENDEKTVDIILKIVNFADQTPEEYITSLSEDDPDGKYSVYNEEYYIKTITEKERKEMLKELANKSKIDKAFDDIFTMEDFEGTFIKMDYDDSFQHFTFYVNKEKYINKKLMCDLSIGLLLISISDSAQAYNLIEPDDRISEFQIIDNETNEIIYDSNQSDENE